MLDNKPKQMTLEIPMNLDRMIPDNHIARTIVEYVKLLDLSSIEEKYSSNFGRKSYPVSYMLSMVLYGYTCGIYSTRALEEACKYNIVFMWIMNLAAPDHATIHRFQQRIIGTEDDLSKEETSILLKNKFIDLKNISIDGTKIRSVANKYTNVYRGTVGYHERKMEEKISKAIKNAIEATESKVYENNADDDDDIDPSSTSSGSFNEKSASQSTKSNINKIEIPEEIKAIMEIVICDNELPSKKRNKEYEPQISMEQIFNIIYWLLSFDENEIKQTKEFKELYKMMDDVFLRKAKYISQREKLGSRNSYSKTDEDASFMQLKEDSMQNSELNPAYNVQQANCNGFFMGFTVSNEVSDTRQLQKVIEFLEYTNAIIDGTTILADAGYGSNENYQMLIEKKIDHLIPYMTQKYEQRRKYLNNPVNRDKFFVMKEKEIVMCPAKQVMEYTHTAKTISPSGFASYKDVYKCTDCSGCKYVELCSKNKQARNIMFDTNWEYQKRRVRQLFSIKENLKQYKERFLVEQGFARIKYNKKLSRFRNYGIKMNMAILTLIGMSCNVQRVHELQNTRINPFINLTYEKMSLLLGSFFV